MMIQGVSISEMLNQSMTVLTNPKVESFERFERHGGQREALIYVGIAAALSGVVGFLGSLIFSGILAAIISLVGGLLTPVLMFYVFAFVLFYMGKQQGGTGTQDEVFYTCALYTAPLLAISGIVGNIPVLSCLAAPALLVLSLYQLYLGYLASRSSMNLPQTPAIISVVIAIIGQLVIATIIGLVMATISTALGINVTSFPNT